MRHWVKLWTEMLDDPKMGRLTDRQHRLCTNLFCLAGIIDDDGRLLSTEDIAYRVRRDNSTVAEDMAALAAVNIVEQVDGAWYLVHFGARNEKPPSAQPEAIRDRVNRYREKQRECNDDVTTLQENVTTTLRNVTPLDKIREEEIRSDSDQIQKREDNSTFIPEVLSPVEAKPATPPGEKPPKKAKSPPGNGHSPAMMFTALAAAYRMDTALLTERDRGRLNATTKRLTAAGYTTDEIADAGQFWWAEDWRGKKGSPPTDSQFFQVIAQRRAFRQANAPPPVVELPAMGEQG